MGFFDALFGGKSKPAEQGWRRFFERHEPEPEPRVREFLVQVAQAAGVPDPRVELNTEDSEGELRGTVSGIEFRIVVDFSGSIRDLCLVYESKHGSIDLEYDPEVEKAKSGRHLLAPGIYVAGSHADGERDRFNALPADLRQRVLEGMKRHRIRYFRSHSDEHDVTLWDDLHEVPEPVGYLSDVLRLAARMAKARGVAKRATRGNGARLDSQERLRTFGALEDDAKWSVARELASELGSTLPGSRVVEREDDLEIDVGWEEDGVPVRVVFDVSYEQMDAFARVEGVSDEFVLRHGPELGIGAPDADGGGDIADRHVFVAKQMYLHGREAKTVKQAEFLRALPGPVLASLCGLVERNRFIEFEDGELHVMTGNFDELESLDDSVVIARELGRIAKVLPQCQ